MPLKINCVWFYFGFRESQILSFLFFFLLQYLRSFGCEFDDDLKPYEIINDKECSFEEAICYFTLDTVTVTHVCRLYMICCKEKGTVFYCSMRTQILQFDRTKPQFAAFDECKDCCYYTTIHVNSTDFTGIFCTCRGKDRSMYSSYVKNSL